MKKYLSQFIFLVVIILGFEDCHRDPPVTKQHAVNPGDPDSLYQGTPISFATISPNAAFLLGKQLANPIYDSLTTQGIQLGRMLFYDKHLSLDGHKACASCHQLKYAMSDSGYAVSVNEFGHTERNAMPLENIAYAPSLFWDGRQPSIAAAAQDAAQHELGLPVTNALAYLQQDTTYVKLFKKAFGRPGNITESKIYNAIQEFLVSAITCDSRFDSIQLGIVNATPQEVDAFTMFTNEIGDCFHCHAPFNGFSQLMTNYSFQNNGLDSVHSIYDFKDPGRGGITGNPDDYGTFKTPSLRNVAVSGPYMHDGRYTTLQQVINHYSDTLYNSPNLNSFLLKHFAKDSNGVAVEVGGLHLNPTQKQEFLIFLNNFTDTSFLNNPNLRSPF